MFESRMEKVSEYFLGRPYITGLLDSETGEERFCKRFDGFDCVTYVETVLAAALSRGPDQFAEILRKIRYRNGNVTWLDRNHYMTLWVKRNQRQGFVHLLRFNTGTVHKDRVLSVLQGYPPVKVKFECLQKKFISRNHNRIHSGDIILFGSTRIHLDVFHVGLLVRKGEEIFLRHAARSRGKVVEQTLGSFLKANRMSGVMIIRPAGKSKIRRSRCVI
jgi:hypothetical protein